MLGILLRINLSVHRTLPESVCKVLEHACKSVTHPIFLCAMIFSLTNFDHSERIFFLYFTSLSKRFYFYMKVFSSKSEAHSSFLMCSFSEKTGCAECRKHQALNCYIIRNHVLYYQLFRRSDTTLSIACSSHNKAL